MEDLDGIPQALAGDPQLVQFGNRRIGKMSQGQEGIAGHSQGDPTQILDSQSPRTNQNSRPAISNIVSTLSTNFPRDALAATFTSLCWTSRRSPSSRSHA